MSKKEYFDKDGQPLDARFHITQDHLSDQDLRKLDITSLNPLSPEVRFLFYFVLVFLSFFSILPLFQFLQSQKNIYISIQINPHQY
jgi:hypothetical protein